MKSEENIKGRVMNRAIFLDRDGTIIKDEGHVHKIEDLEFINMAVEGLKRMQKLKYKLIIIVNQAGIGRGLYTEKDYFSFRNEINKRLKEKAVLINAEYFCPHHPEKGIGEYKIDCNCRKPKAGLLKQAAKDFDLDLKNCWMIGDSVFDIKTGKNAGCRTIQVMTGKEKIHSDEADFIADNLFNASYFIID